MAKQHDNTQQRILKADQDSSNCYLCDSAIFDLDLPSVEKLTFIALTRYFTSKDSAMPSYKDLARDVGCSEVRIVQAMKRLKEHIEFVPGPVIVKKNPSQQ